MAERVFTSGRYYEAAVEHLGIARQLLAQRQYLVAHYWCGLVVEEMLRSLAQQDDETFDSSHSIRYWAGRVASLPATSEEGQTSIRTCVDEVNMRWRSNQRYMTSGMLGSYLHGTGLDRIRGDRVKYSSNRLFECATEIVSFGRLRWQSKKR